MSLKSELFFPGWWKYVILGPVLPLLCGCSSAPVSEPKYPEYNKWWTQSVNTNSFEGLGPGDVCVHEYVVTNPVISVPGGDVRREVTTNRTEAVLL